MSPNTSERVSRSPKIKATTTRATAFLIGVGSIHLVVSWSRSNVSVIGFYSATLRRERNCYRNSSVRPSVCDVEVSRSHRLE